MLLKISQKLKTSVLNYNRLNPNLTFENFVQGKSNEIALSYSKEFVRIYLGITHYTYMAELDWAKHTFSMP